MKTSLLAALAISLAAPAFAGNEFQPEMEAYLAENVQDWATAPVLVDALRAQNAAYADLTQADIDALDTAWRAEVGSSSMPSVTPVLNNAAADFLREQIAASGGQITEVILMDSHGLNVAVSHVTSDMWQGDEAKHAETFDIGAGAVHYGEIEEDESTGAYQAQISFTIVDPESGEPIGAMTVAVDAEMFL